MYDEVPGDKHDISKEGKMSGKVMLGNEIYIICFKYFPKLAFFFIKERNLTKFPLTYFNS